MDFSNNFKDSTSEGQFQSLNVSDAQSRESLQIKDFKLSSQSQTKEENLMHTQTSATIASLIMGSADAEDLSLEQIQVDLEGEQEIGRASCRERVWQYV